MKNSAIKKIIIALVLCLSLCVFALAFVACGTGSGNTSGGTVNSNSAVYSNGGTIVSYDGYVYYVNGIPDYTDENGKTNVQGSVIKGALYRAKITEGRHSLVYEEGLEKNLLDGVVDHNIKDNGELRDVMDFEYEKLDYKALREYSIGDPEKEEDPLNSDGSYNCVPTNDSKSAYAIKSEAVISKKIGTAGYDGGFWIYDGKIYFASPDTNRNADGVVQADRAQFYCYDIQTKSMTEVYTAKQASTSMPYAFYKQGDYVYLLTYEKYYANAEDEDNDILTGFINSTRIKNGSVEETKEIYAGADSVYFPKKTTYDPTTDKESGYDSINDFAYFTYSIKGAEAKSGYSLQMISFDGEYIEEITHNTEQLSINGSAGNFLYFTNPTSSSKGLDFTDCYAQRRKIVAKRDGDDAAKNVEDYVTACGAKKFTLLSDAGAYTTILPIYDDQVQGNKIDNPTVIATNSSGFFRFEVLGDTVVKTQVYNGDSTLLGHYDGKVYGFLTNITDEKEEGDDSDETTEGKSEEEQEYAYIFACSDYQPYTAQTLKLYDASSLPKLTPYSVDFFRISYDILKDDGTVESSTTESYISFFSFHGGFAEDYMTINKVSGTFDFDSSISVHLSVIPEFELQHVMCYDTDCINWHHNHSSWETFEDPDDLESGEEEGLDSTFS